VHEQRNIRHAAGRRSVKRDRAAAYQTIEKMRSALDDERRRRERYRKQLARLQRKLSPSQMGDTPTQSNSPAIIATPSPTGSTLLSTPRSKTRGMLCGSTVRVDSNVGKALLLHNIMIESGKNKRRAKTKKGQLECALIEKYRLKNFTKKSGLSALKETYNRATRFDALDDDTRKLVAVFFERDDNSRLETGRKDTRTKNKIKQQKGSYLALAS